MREIIFDDSADLWSLIHDYDQELYDHHKGPSNAEVVSGHVVPGKLT